MRVLEFVSSSILPIFVSAERAQASEPHIHHISYQILLTAERLQSSYLTSLKPQFPQLQNMDLDYTFYTVIFVTTK